MTHTESSAYDRGFLAGANLRVDELRQAEAELATRRRWSRGLRLGLVGALVWASAITVALVLIIWR